MKVLVTGTAGFIGFHVAQRLLDRGEQVIGIDNFNDYYPPAIKRERHKRLAAHDAFTGLVADIADHDAVRRVFAEHRPDIVCHLAAQAGVRYSITHPEVYIRSNIDGFHHVIKESLANGIRRFVYASSSSVYGGNTKLPFSEDDRVDRPISLYAATKRSNELMAHALSHLHGMQTVGLRFFTVYGPWGRPDMAMWQFAQNMMHGRPIDVFNYGNMKRDFTYIDDIVQGIVAALESTKLEPYEIFNLGNNKPVDLLHVVKLLEAGLGATADMKLKPMQQGDVPTTYADIDRARRKLGFEPTTTIEDGIERFLAWVREHKALFLATTFSS